VYAYSVGDPGDVEEVGGRNLQLYRANQRCPIDACTADLYTSRPRAVDSARRCVAVFYFALVERLPRRSAISEET